MITEVNSGTYLSLPGFRVLYRLSWLFNHDSITVANMAVKESEIAVLLRMDKSDAEILDEICRKDKRTRPQLLRILISDLSNRYQKFGKVLDPRNS